MKRKASRRKAEIFLQPVFDEQSGGDAEGDDGRFGDGAGAAGRLLRQGRDRIEAEEAQHAERGGAEDHAWADLAGVEQGRH